MRAEVFALLIFGAVVAAGDRVKRQSQYQQFPGPRGDAAYGGQQAVYPRQQQPQQQQAAYAPEEDDSSLYQAAPRRQFQAQPVQQYTPRQPPAAAPPPPPPAPIQYESQSRPSSSSGRKKASASQQRSSGTKFGGGVPQQQLNGGGAEDEPEEDEGPDALTLLLQDSKFACSQKADGYYADDSVNCQVFHYCVGGARHSWMCPAGTVFHQVHLNCVPDSQDICAQSQKFHFVNDYLYKPADYEGPNNTARYYQRYYPEGYVAGDTIVAPQTPSRPQQQARAPEPAYRAAPPQTQHVQPPSRRVNRPAPPPPQQQPAYDIPQQNIPLPNQAPASGPSRSARPPSRPSPAYQPPPEAVYRPVQTAPVAAAPPSYPDYTKLRQAPQSRPQTSQGQPEGNLYRAPAAAATPRRPAAPPPPPQRAYIPRQYAAQAPVAAPAPAQQRYNYGNQAAGVQYDDEY